MTGIILNRKEIKMTGIILNRKEIETQIELLEDFKYNIDDPSFKSNLKMKIDYLRDKLSDKSNNINLNKKQCISLIDLFEEADKIYSKYSKRVHEKVRNIKKELLK